MNTLEIAFHMIRLPTLEKKSCMYVYTGKLNRVKAPLVIGGCTCEAHDCFMFGYMDSVRAFTLMSMLFSEFSILTIHV